MIEETNKELEQYYEEMLSMFRTAGLEDTNRGLRNKC